MTDDNHDYDHTYRVPVTGHGNITVAADTPEQAQEIAPDYVEKHDLSVDSDPIHRETVVDSEDERPMSDARNVSSNLVDIPDVPTGWHFHKSRRALGLTQVEVANRMGVARTTVTGWENDEYRMTLGDASQYAGVLIDEQNRQQGGG